MGYRFLNLNPLGKKEKDCVCRAISNVTNTPYYEIERKLHETANLFDCEYLCVCCYKFLLDYVFCFERIEEYQGKPIHIFLRDFPYGTFLIRVEGHLTSVKNGNIEDIWDCRDEIIDIIWHCE